MRVKLDLSTDDIYNIWKERNPELAKKVPYKQYKKFIGEVNNAVVQELYTNINGVKLPWGLGKLMIMLKPMYMAGGAKYLSIDWAQTKKHKKIIYHINDHSRNMKPIWMWDRFKSRFKHKNLFQLDFIRRHDRELARQIIVLKNMNFYQLPKKKTI